MKKRTMRLAWSLCLLPLAGCGWLPDAYTGCEKVRPYASAREEPSLRVPAGADLPDTRNALKIPDVAAPKTPPEPGSCLEHPPPYGSDRPQAEPASA